MSVSKLEGHKNTISTVSLLFLLAAASHETDGSWVRRPLLPHSEVELMTDTLQFLVLRKKT